VNFSNIQDAERALDTLNYQPVKGRPIRIMWKQRDPSLRRSGVGNIFIKNLDKTVDSRTLHDTFSLFGNIISCKVVGDDTGDSRGFGFVQYQTQEEADLAIKKVNGNKIMDKKVTVTQFKHAADRPSSKFSNVFVKNLPKTLTEKDFVNFFGKFGEISSGVLKTDEAGESLGFGFLQFESHEDAEKAVNEVNGTKAFDDELEIYCGPHMKKHQRALINKKKAEQRRQETAAKHQGNNLYIKHLDETFNDEALRKEFARFGTITSAKVVADEKGSCKGFGYVCFSNQEEATRAVTEMNGKMLGSKPLFVALHQPRPVRQAQLAQQRVPMMRGAGFHGQIPFQPGMPFLYPGAAARPGMMLVPGNVPSRFYPQRPIMSNQGGRNAQRGAPYNRQPRASQMPGPVAPVPAIPVQQAGVQYKGNVRNPQRPGGPMAPAVPQAAPVAAPAVPTQVPAGGSSTEFTSKLLNATPEQQKQMLGERLFVQIAPNHGQLAGKITGMLLDGLDVNDLLHLIEDPTALKEKVDVAIEALQQHQQKQEAAHA
jgi:polyadenylate-binding protein